MSVQDPFEALASRRAHAQNLAEKLQLLGQELIKRQKSLDRFSNFNPEIEQDKLKHLIHTDHALCEKIAQQDREARLAGRKLGRLRALFAPKIMIWHYYSLAQKHLRQDCAELSRREAALRKANERNNAELRQLRKMRQSLEEDLTLFETFDRDQALSDIASIWAENEKLLQQQRDTQAQLAIIDEKLSPHIQECERLKTTLLTHQADLQLANTLEARLSAAPNSYEKAMIHQECKKLFDNERPKEVIALTRSKIRTLEGNIPKIERRIREELIKVQREIHSLILDGNNLCYRESEFIGLQALKVLLQSIEPLYRTVVVFDASIRKLMNADDSAIKEALGGASNVHIAPSKTSADEYVLKLAGDDHFTYVISNDRFAEYHDYSAIRSERLIRFMITTDKIMINDLDISLDI